LAKTLEFTDTSAKTVKIGDTTTSFTMVLGEDSNPVDLTNATSIIAKLGDSTGYLKSQTVTSDNIQDPLSGKVIIKFDSDFMSGLPAGYYLLEVWVTYSSGTAIYPSGDLTGFTINNNIESQSGSVIKTITYDDFVKAMNKAASTIAKGDKGDKGDTGTVDNAGLTKAPAFVELKTQVDNSAVGTNLLTGTDKDISITSHTTDGYPGWVNTDIGFSFEHGKTYTFSAEAKNSTDKVAEASIRVWDTITGHAGIVLYAFPADGERHSVTITIPNDSHDYHLLLYAGHAGIVPGVDVTTTYHHPKLEKGTLATDWCPNPSEILTQSDYAKIQAAIIALGGSLK